MVGHRTRRRWRHDFAYRIGFPLMGEASVRVWEEQVELPTYVVDSPDPMPRFYEADEHQGVQRRLYPYPVNDALTRRREKRT